MDETLLQEWSEKLSALRTKRAEEVGKRGQNNDSFTPAEFFKISAGSLEEILDQWYSLETLPGSKVPDVDTLRAELDSVIEFEVDAISRDLSAAKPPRWTQEEIDEALEKFETSTEELKKKYVLKTSAPPPSAPAPKGKKSRGAQAAVQREIYGGGSGGGSSMGIIGMFVVGVILGAGPSVYFWDQARRLEKTQQEERTRLLTEQRALEDGMTMLHERFDQLATGKIRNIPEIEREIEKIRRTITEKRQEAENQYLRERERLMKKTPAGGKLDQALTEIAERRNVRVAELEAQEAQQVEPLEKQKKTLQELRVR